MQSRQAWIVRSLMGIAALGCGRTTEEHLGSAGRSGESSSGMISMPSASSGALSVGTSSASGESGATSSESGGTPEDAASMPRASDAFVAVDDGRVSDEGGLEGGGLDEGGLDEGGCGPLCTACQDAHCVQTLSATAVVDDIVASLIVQGDNLYWVNAGAGTVGTIPVAGGTATTVTTTARAQYHLAANHTNLSFWDADDGIWTAPLTGGGATRVGTFALPVTAITMDQGNVYWAGNLPGQVNSGAIVTAPVAGASQPLASGQASPAGIAVDAANVYWTDRATGQNDGAVMQLAFGSHTPIAIASAQTNPGGIAVDAHDVYWLSEAGVFKVPIGGGTILPLSSAKPYPSSSFVVDGISAYWVDSSTYAIVKAPLAGGPVVAVVPMPSVQPDRGLAVDATSVYWASAAFGIAKATPK